MATVTVTLTESDVDSIVSAFGALESDYRELDDAEIALLGHLVAAIALAKEEAS
jgi:hypothetical protein